MSGFSTDSNSHLIRSELWTSQLKEVLQDSLMGMKYIRMLTDFPDGEVFTMPSIGQAEVYDYAEGQAIQYSAMATGEFQFSITDYLASGTYITEKMKQDSYYTSELMASFIPAQERAIMERIERDVLALGPDNQTVANTNSINGGRHRFVGSGTNETISVDDFAAVRYALQKASVPLTNLVAIVDPSVAHTLATIPNISSISNNPRWEGIVASGISTGMNFVVNIHGFDIYESNYLKQNTASETIGGVTAAAGVNNLFFSATPGMTLPFVGAMRQPPRVQSEFNKDLQRDEYVTTCRYGLGLFRPENLVVVVTDTDQVYA